ncbi:hypothetical protein D3C75_1090520 [compost metagenome]
MIANNPVISISGVLFKSVVETISLISAIIRPITYRNNSGYIKAIGVPIQRPNCAGNHWTSDSPGFIRIKVV